jgi:phosphoribosylanthranilate isomerase
MIIKICGITTMEEALAVEEYGADWIGFVFAPSRRQIALEQAAKICQRLSHVKKVGVFVDAPLASVAEAVQCCALDLVQLHGQESASYCEQVSVPVIKAVHIGESVPVFLPGKVDWLLFDTVSAGQRGGTGKAFDWQSYYGLRKEAKVPVLLAGGLTAHNVGEAIERFHPDGVDVSGGVETEGLKDLTKIREFIAAVRSGGGEESCLKKL